MTSMDEAQQFTKFSCAAMKQGTAGGNDPADCDWPVCGCDGYADRVIEALRESGWMSPNEVQAYSRTTRELVLREVEAERQID